MLKTASVTRALSPPTLVAALGFSAMLLPVSPSLGTQPETPPDAPMQMMPTFPAVAVTDVPMTMPGTLDIRSDDSSSPEDQLKAARKEIQNLRQRLAQAEARLAMYKRTTASVEKSDGQSESYRLRANGDGAEDQLAATDPATGRFKEIVADPRSAPARSAQKAERLDQLEAQLDDLLKEIQSIRRHSTRPETSDVSVSK